MLCDNSNAKKQKKRKESKVGDRKWGGGSFRKNREDLTKKVMYE